MLFRSSFFGMGRAPTGIAVTGVSLLPRHPPEGRVLAIGPAAPLEGVPAAPPAVSAAPAAAAPEGAEPLADAPRAAAGPAALAAPSEGAASAVPAGADLAAAGPAGSAAAGPAALAEVPGAAASAAGAEPDCDHRKSPSVQRAGGDFASANEGFKRK